MNCQDAMHALSAAEIEIFGRDGYLAVPAMYDAAAVGKIAAWSDELCAWPEVPGRHMVYYEDSLYSRRLPRRVAD